VTFIQPTFRVQTNSETVIISPRLDHRDSTLKPSYLLAVVAAAPFNYSTTIYAWRHRERCAASVSLQ